MSHRGETRYPGFSVEGSSSGNQGRPSLPPVVGRLDAKTAAALRAVVQQRFAQLALTVDEIPGIEASMLLIAERRTPPNPTIGDAIVEGVLKLGRP